MKNICIAIILFYTLNLAAQTQLTLQSQPEKAIVFLNGAQLYHSRSVQLAAGITDVILEGVPASIDANSLQAGGKGDFTILDVQYRMQYPEPVTATVLPDAIQKKIKLVSDSVTHVNYELQELQDQYNVLDYEKSMMLNSKLITGGAKTDSIELLQKAVDYYHAKLNDIFTQQTGLRKKMDAQNEVLNKLQLRLADLNNYWAQQNALINPNNPVPQIVVSVNTELATTATLTVNYVTYNAGWYATYDIRATDIAKPVQLNYKANIWQNTGIDWKNVKLTCSTGNPMLGNNLPELTTWYVGYYQEYYQRDYDDVSAAPETKSLDMEQSTMSGYARADEDKRKDATNASNYTTPAVTIANVEFEINLSYNIPSDGKAHLVSLQSETMPSDYDYLVVPKIDQAAFLIARITDWENKNLLPGNANIYFNNTYVGKTYLDPLALNDTLSVSLGRDRSIEVKRTQISDKSTDKLIGLNNKKTMAYEINVRNGKAVNIDVIVKDQLPISQDDDIKVALLEKDGGELNEDTGIITWRKTLKPKEQNTYELEFEISYPKNTTLGSL